MFQRVNGGRWVGDRDLRIPIRRRGDIFDIEGGKDQIVSRREPGNQSGMRFEEHVMSCHLQEMKGSMLFI